MKKIYANIFAGVCTLLALANTGSCINQTKDLHKYNSPEIYYYRELTKIEKKGLNYLVSEQKEDLSNRFPGLRDIERALSEKERQARYYAAGGLLSLIVGTFFLETASRRS